MQGAGPGQPQILNTTSVCQENGRCLQRCGTGPQLWGIHFAVCFIRRRPCFSHDVGRPCWFSLREAVLGVYRFMGKPWDVGQGRGLAAAQMLRCVVLLAVIVFLVDAASFCCGLHVEHMLHHAAA